MKYDYFVMFGSSKLYLPCDGHVLSMFGAWFGGTAYRRVSGDKAAIYRKTDSLNKGIVQVLINGQDVRQNALLPIFDTGDLVRFRLTLTHAIKDDFNGTRFVYVSVFRRRDLESVGVGV